MERLERGSHFGSANVGGVSLASRRRDVRFEK